MAWTYSDYVTSDPGTLTRLQRLRLHVQEVSDALQGSDTVAGEGFSLTPPQLQAYLKKLQEDEQDEYRRYQLRQGNRLRMTRGVPKT